MNVDDLKKAAQNCVVKDLRDIYESMVYNPESAMGRLRLAWCWFDHPEGSESYNVVLDRAASIMEARADHYAEQVDRYKNFEAACAISRRNDITEIAAEFALKHLAYLYTTLTGQKATYDEIVEAFCDAHNYCLICDEILKGNE